MYLMSHSLLQGASAVQSAIERLHLDDIRSLDTNRRVQPQVVVASSSDGIVGRHHQLRAREP
jgi:hypothetical protein